MPVILKLESSGQGALSGAFAAYRLTRTKCVTETGTYEFTKVYGLETSTNDALLGACSALQPDPMAAKVTEVLFLRITTAETSTTADLVDALVNCQSRELELGQDEIMLSAIEERDHCLVDLIEPMSRATVVQDDDGLFRVQGWSLKGYAQSRKVLKLARRGACIVQARAAQHNITVIDVPSNDSTSGLLQSLATLVTLLIESRDRSKTYFPYRDSAVTKLLWTQLFCRPAALLTFLMCDLASHTAEALLQLGDRLSYLEAHCANKPGAPFLRPLDGKGDVSTETRVLAALVLKVKQRQDEWIATNYARRIAARRERAAALQREYNIRMCALRAQLASLEAERRRKAEALEDKRHQYQDDAVEYSGTAHQRFQHELELAKATLFGLQNELKVNQDALASARALTPAERDRGNIRQIEFNLRSLKAQCRHLHS